MSDDHQRDRRKTPRAEVLLKVEYQDADALLTDYLSNLAEGGLFVHTEVPFEIGRRLTFSVSFPGVLDPTTLTGIVRWQQQRDPERSDERAGVGVEFVFDTEEQREQIRSLVAQIRTTTTHASSGRRRPLRVLLVEDNEFVHDLYRHAVTSLERDADATRDVEIISALDGQQALVCLDAGPIDLAVIDHFLPDMLGCEIVARIRTMPQFAQIPILVASVGGPGVREQALSAGADLYIDKPVQLKHLASTLRLLVSKQKLIAELRNAAS